MVRCGRVLTIVSKVSVIIPSYRDPLLNKTIESVFRAAKEDVEIIVFIDDFLPRQLEELIESNRIFYIMSEENVGMRHAINQAVKVSSGKYIMKLDSHCDISKGFDVELKSTTKENMVSVPSRYNLNPKKWKKFNGPIDFLYLKYPKRMKSIKLGMDLFEEKIRSEDNKPIEEIIAFQGACWFMHKSFFEKIGGLDEEIFSSFGAEAHEISMKTWLCHQGIVVRNRNTWYAHYRPSNVWSSKPKKLRKEMLYSMKRAFSLDMLNKWSNQKKTFRWVIDKFGPFPGWPKDWYKEEYIQSLKDKGYIC